MDLQGSSANLQGSTTPRVQTSGALSYIGNPDFRGYLNYLGTTGNQQASQYLNQGIGNDARFAGGRSDPNAQNLYNQYLSLTNPQGGLQGLRISIPGPYIPPTAPYINTNAIRASSNAQAANQVNPLYDQYLNQYLQNETANKALYEKQYNTDPAKGPLGTEVLNLQAQLANQLQGTELQRTATSENVANSLANINTQETAFQKQSGLQNDIARRQTLESQGALAGSGLGQQQDVQSQELRNIKESAQEGQYTYSRNQQNLFKSQTFAQLQNSDELNRLKETEGENASAFTLASYLQQAANEEFQFQRQNEEQRQQAQLQAANNLYTQNIINTIAQYKNNLPLYQAAYQAYVR